MWQGYTPNVRESASKSIWDILIWSDSPSSLGPKRRTMAILVAIGGCLTFFLPLISTHPPVFFTSHWSPFDIVRQMYLGHLPQPVCERCNEPVPRSCMALPILVDSIYGLMLCALVVAWFRNSRRLAWIGIVGAWLSLGTYMFRYGTNFATKWEFETTFYGQPQSLNSSSEGPVLYGWLTLALLAVMAALVFIAVREDIDAKRSRDSRTGAQDFN